MLHQLIVVSDTKTSPTTSWLEYKNYDEHPMLCRFGTWIGVHKEFTQAIVLSYEHEPEPLYVGWALNGILVIDPGYDPGPPGGKKVPGFPTVTFICPFENTFHRIQLTSTPGEDEVCLQVQVLYRPVEQPYDPPTYGPTSRVCLSGRAVTWPKHKLEGEARCLDKVNTRLRRYLELPWVPRREPTEEAWIERIRREEVSKLIAQFEALEELDPEIDRDLAEAVRSNIVKSVQWFRSPGASLSREVLPTRRSEGQPKG